MIKNVLQILLFLIFFAASYNTFKLEAQIIERKEVNLPEISQPITKLKKAIGWTLQDNGQWISCNNCIPNTNADINKTNDPENKLGKHNFTEMQLREVLIQGEQYAILLVFRRNGYFKFETLRDEWNSRNDVDFYVFKATKLKQILPDTLPSGKIWLTNMDVFCMGKIEGFDQKTYLQKIANQIQRQYVLKYPSTFTLLFAVMPLNLKNEKFVRFRLIEVFNKEYIYSQYFLNDYLPHLLDKFYYEVPYGNFIEFVRIFPVYEDLIAQPKSFNEYYKRGVALFKRKEYASAAADFHHAIDLFPGQSFFLAYAYLGNCYYNMEMLDEALMFFNLAIDNKPEQSEYIYDWARVLYNRGLVNYKLKNSNLACDDWNKASIYGISEAQKMLKKHCK